MSKYQPLTRETLPLFRDRLSRINPGDKPLFGKLEPAGMVAHLTFFVELSNGKRTEPFAGNFLTRTRFFQWFFLDILSIPKGKIKVADHWSPVPEGNLDAERLKLYGEMEEFVAALERNPEQATFNPLFGEIPLRVSAKAHGKHFEHHLQQYGV